MNGQRERCRGFVQIDGVIAIAVMLVLVGVLAKTTLWSRRATDRLADARAATAVAESALVALAQGKPAPAGVSVEPAAPESAVPDHRWVRVTAVVHGRSVTLVGLARGDK